MKQSVRQSKPRVLKSIADSLTPVNHPPLNARDFGLSDKEQMWSENYLQHFNASRASLVVGCPGDPRKHGWRMKQNPKVQAYINARVAQHSISANEVLARLSAYACADMGDFTTDHGIDIAEGVRNGRMFLVKKYSKGKNDAQSIELVDSLAALKLLLEIHLTKNTGRLDRDAEERDEAFKKARECFHL